MNAANENLREPTCPAVLLVMVGALAWVSTASAVEVPGTIPGTFSVGPNGDAVYSMPIQVPPGTGGIQPNLSAPEK